MKIVSHGHMAEKRDLAEYVCLVLGASKVQMYKTGSISLNSLFVKWDLTLIPRAIVKIALFCHSNEADKYRPYLMWTKERPRHFSPAHQASLLVGKINPQPLSLI